jgi:transcriptional regulator with XRE-family HTH domain
MINSAAEIIGTQLRKFREDRGLSLRQAGKELGVTHQTIDNCEKGKRPPKLTLLIAAITKWNVSFELNGCQVVPKELMQARAPNPEPVQGAFRLRPRGKYQGKTVSIRQRDNELVIITVAKINSRP